MGECGQEERKNEVELRRDGYHDGWTTTVWRFIKGFLLPGNYLRSTAVGLFLQRKHLTSAKYETVDAKEH